MRASRCLACVASLIPLISAPDAAAQDPEGLRHSSVRADGSYALDLDADPLPLPRLESPIRLDGVLDEPAWQRVVSLPLITLEPVSGQPPSEHTDIRVAYDDRAIYVGARLGSSHPEGPVVNSYTRDRWADDDIIEIVLDTYNDNENGVVFTVNSVGTRLDAQVSHDAEFTYGFPVNYSWNNFWDAVTARYEGGWTAEIRIPFSSLRFQSTDGRVVMGMIVNRYIARENESSTFPQIDPSWNFGVNKPSQARDVVFTGVDSERPVRASPYLLGGIERTWQPAAARPFPDDATTTGEIGGDVRFALRDNMNVDLTLNTDFAQVEADDQQVNLSRFSLFFPEKRQFFQERAGIFDFRTGGSNRLFHSRRIGIVAGERVRILGGGRMVGRVGGWDLGFLDLQTGEGPAGAGENFGVVRARRRVVNEFSYVGAMVTSRVGGGAENLAWGLDGSVRLGGARNLTVNLAQSFDDGDGGMSSATGRLLIEDRDRVGLGYRISLGRVGDAFDPGVGFVRRLDYREASGQLVWGFFPGEESAIRRVGPRLEGTWLVRDSDGRLETGELSTGWELELKSGASLNGGVVVTREELAEGFELGDGTPVPPGRHDFVWGRFFARSPSAGAVSASLFGQVGEFFDGTIVSGTLSPRWRVSPHLEIQADFEHSRIRFDGRDEAFDADVVRLRTTISPNIRISVEAFLQYLSVDDVLLGNLRARYNFSEGRDLWVVVNEVRNTHLHGADLLNPPVENRTLLVKYVHTFDAF